MNRTISKYLLAIIVFNLVSIHGLRSQDDQIDSDWRNIDSQVRELINGKEFSGFNGSVLIGKNGEYLVQQSFGWTDVNRLEEITKDSRFNVGSLSKEIPAIIILEEIKDGKLSYESNVQEFLKDLPDWSHDIKIRDLLFYRSGLPEIDFKSVKNDDLAIEKLRQITSLQFEPGSEYYYSNYNNFILAKIVEQLIGEEFQTYVEENYLTRLGMNGTFYDGSAPDVKKSMTSSYSDVYGDDITGNTDFKQFKLCYAPLYMTIEDILKWLEFVRENYSPNDQDVVEFYSPTTIQEQGPLGIIQYENGEVKAHIHGGYAYNYGTSTYLDYNTGIAVIIVTNANRNVSLSDLNKAILQIIENSGLN